jgi:AcrR family transcriptional regulator
VRTLEAGDRRTERHSTIRNSGSTTWYSPVATMTPSKFRAPSTTPLAVAPRLSEPERRLLRAIASVVAEKGYAAATIADIVQHAQASKTTFYQHYSGKLDLFLTAYQRGSDRLVRRMVAGGAASAGSWPQRVRGALLAYLTVLVDSPATTRSFTMEIHAAGPEAVAVRRAMHRRTATALSELVDDLRRDEPTLHPLEPALADCIVGAMTELVVIAVADGRTANLLELVEPLAQLTFAVLTAPAIPADGHS